VGQQREGDRRCPDGPATGAFLVELRLDVTEAPAGTIRPGSGEPARSFHGWLEFMALVDQLRAEARPGPRP
jgi:hypothetical protein